MRPYLITAKLMRPSNMKRFPTPALDHTKVNVIPYQVLTSPIAETGSLLGRLFIYLAWNIIILIKIQKTLIRQNCKWEHRQQRHRPCNAMRSVYRATWNSILCNSAMKLQYDPQNFWSTQRLDNNIVILSQLFILFPINSMYDILL
jgi:hypothetical protein